MSRKKARETFIYFRLAVIFQSNVIFNSQLKTVFYTLQLFYFTKKMYIYGHYILYVKYLPSHMKQTIATLKVSECFHIRS